MWDVCYNMLLQYNVAAVVYHYIKNWFGLLTTLLYRPGSKITVKLEKYSCNFSDDL